MKKYFNSYIFGQLLKTFIALALFSSQAGAKEFNYDERQGLCIGYLAVYYNIPNSNITPWNNVYKKLKPRVDYIFQIVGNCMKGRSDSVENNKYCATTTLSKSDLDFYNRFGNTLSKSSTLLTYDPQVILNQMNNYCAEYR